MCGHVSVSLGWYHLNGHRREFLRPIEVTRQERESMKRLELALATTSLELGVAPARPPVVEMIMCPYLDFKGLAKEWRL